MASIDASAYSDRLEKLNQKNESLKKKSDLVQKYAKEKQENMIDPDEFKEAMANYTTGYASSNTGGQWTGGGTYQVYPTNPNIASPSPFAPNPNYTYSNPVLDTAILEEQIKLLEEKLDVIAEKMDLLFDVIELLQLRGIGGS